MAYILRANNKDYTVSYHALQRMIERSIPEEMIIAALENGSLIEQPHGNDRYEYQLYDEDLEDIVIVQVIVDEASQTIVTVMDVTE
ncbi:MAG: DUF4258 domain-containing protein [Anaerolineae bacterium]|nr:DUF4258 domain-containing protein [Anaerolineae bacterium]